MTAAVLFTLWLSCTGVFVWLIRRAPEGWESADGFRFGSPPFIADEGCEVPLSEAFQNVGRERADTLASAEPVSLHDQKVGQQ